MLGVAAGDRHGGAAGMAGLPADGLKQQWPAGDRFAMMMGVGQAHEQIPPVEEQRDHARNQAAALEVTGREAAPAPLVLQFIENVLAVGTIAIKLTDRKDLAIERGDENGVFPDLIAIIDRGKAEPQLTHIIALSQRHGAFKAPPQYHDAAMPAPSLQAQLTVFALPSAAGILPVLLAHRPFDRTLHVLREPQLEQIVLTALFGLTHHRFVAEIGIAADQPRPLFLPQTIQESP